MVVRLIAMSIWISAGIEARSCGNSANIRSIVSMTFAFGCLLMMTSTAGSLLNKPRLRMSCTESVTAATSDRRTGAPSFHAMTRFLYWFASSVVWSLV